jgi:flavin reductase (DIM6/NTAB) family NADH-FMN oxidoreductase RutF
MATTAIDDQLAADFKLAMRRLTAAIVIVTGCDDGEPFGMAATAFTSVSADPPSVIVGVNRSASLHSPITKGRHFAINLLSSDHRDLVAAFSSSARRAERFAGSDWKTLDGGIPTLSNAVMAMTCTVEAEMDYGSHTMFIGRVNTIDIGKNAEPLLWHDGAFAKGVLHAADEAT